MKRFLRLLLVSCLMALVLCIGAVVIGRGLPQTNYLPELGMCDGVPCYMNIKLNATTWTEAQSILGAAPGFTVKPSYQWTEAATGPVDYLTTTSNTETIVEINLSLRENAVPLWSVVNELGVPCSILTSNGVMFYLSFPDRLVLVLGKKGRIQPRTSVVEIDLGVYQSRVAMLVGQQIKHCRTLAGLNKSAWRGFRQYVRR